MKKIAMMVVCGMFICFLSAADISAQDFTRGTPIPVPETNLNNGGTGGMIAGVDLDGDGHLEIYLVNDNWNDTPTELIPRIYKLEWDGANWNVVWSAVAPVPKQNTWPAFEVYDLDADGKMELWWGPVNYVETGNLNPHRILVYESAGAGSDVMGVDDGAGGYNPNAGWTITPNDNVNIRPTRWIFADPDNDGTTEIMFSDRAGNNGGYYYGVISVDTIPDNGDGSETWTLESSGLDFGLQAGATENKWDVAVIGNNIYTFCEVEISKIFWDGLAWNYKKLMPLAGGVNFITSQVVDLDMNGTKEIIAGEYYWGVDPRSVVLLEEEADSLKHTVLYSVDPLERLFGSAQGDIDQDGYMDFVFGTRTGVPDGAVYRLAYRGGDIRNPASYDFDMIDSEFATGGYWNVIDIANIDGDPELEVLYTASVPCGTFPDLGTKPIVVLDYVGTGVFEKHYITPNQFSLNQNYPNPFNPSTTISYNIPAQERVVLRIYNMLGGEVRTLVDAVETAGFHTVKWDGSDNLGQKVANGVYIYTLQMGQEKISKTMTLAR